MEEETNNKSDVESKKSNKKLSFLNSDSLFEKLLFYVVLIGILFLVLNFGTLIASFEHLPSPVYGGDYYRDRGFIESFIQGFTPQQDGYFLNEMQYYNWFGVILYGFPAKFFNLGIESTMLWFTFLIYLGFIVVYYFIGRELFKKHSYQIITAFLGAIYFLYPIFKFAALANLFASLFILFMLKYIRTKKFKMHILAAIFIALAGLTWGGVYVASMIFYGLWLLIEFIVMIKSDFFSHKKKLNRKLLTKYIILVIPIFIAILIPLLIHYLPLMIHYGSSSPNPVYMYGDLSIEHQTIFRDVFGQIKMFFNFKSIVFFAMGILAFIGLIFSCTSKSKKFSFLKKYYFFNFIARLHHYITKPLIGKWAFPHKMSLYKFVMPVFIMTGLVLIVKYLNKKKKLFGNLVLVLFIILLLIYVPSKVNQYNNDQWIQYGKIMDPGTQMIYDVGDHLKNIMSNEETILANDESSFALMALSGKKVVSSRRTHASYYVDIDKRIADTAIILYGNNNNLRKELISFYKISYFYEDRFIYTNPMTSRLDFQDYLLDNGVQFVINDITLDPARTLETGTIETRVVIPPQNMSSDFRDMLKMNKMFNIEGQVGAIIYHVDINTNTDINAVEENLNFS